MHRIIFKPTAMRSSVILFVLLSVLLNSSNVLAAGSPFAGVHMGTSVGAACESGEFAAIVKDDGTFNLLYHSNFDPDFLGNFVKEGVVIANDGTFSTSASFVDGETIINITLTGTFTATGVNGTFSDDTGCTGTFTGSRLTSSGPLAGAGGYYSGTLDGSVTLNGAPNGTLSGTVAAIVAADGSGMMVHIVEFRDLNNVLDPFTIGGPITVDSGGNFSDTLDDVLVTGSINTSTFTGSGDFSATLVEPEGTFVESGTWSVTRQFPLLLPYNDVVVNIPGTGVSVLFNDNTSSLLLHTDTAETFIMADVDNNGEDDVIVSFPAGTGPDGNGGTYISRNQGALVSLNLKTAEQIVAGNFDGINGDDLLLDFGVDGLWSYLNDSTGSQLTPQSPLTMKVGDVDNSGQEDVVLSFTLFGTVLFTDFTTATVLDASPADVLEVGDIDGNGEDDIAASYAPGNGPGGTGGLFIARNQGPFSQLTPLQPLQSTSGDFDGTGQDDLVFDFGGVTGLVIYLNDATGMFLTTMTPLALSSGDVDSSGKDDLLASFTGIGTLAFKDLTTVDIWDPVNAALDLDTGQVDGN